MINIFDEFKKIFEQALLQLARDNNIEISEDDFAKFIIEPAKEKLHGDLACNAAMALSKKFATCQNLNNPRKLAQSLIDKIQQNKTDLSANFYLKNIIKLEIAGPGFINIFVENAVFYQILSNYPHYYRYR